MSDKILVKVDGGWTDDPGALAASLAAMANKDELKTRLIAALEAEIARLRKERRWIPVGERLPIRPRAVIANVPSAYGPMEAWFHVERGQAGWQGKWCDFKGEWLEHPVTHWQEMPPGPETEEVGRE